MTTFIQDIRYGFRMLAKSPGVTLVGVARAQVRVLDSDQPVYDVRSLEKIIDDGLSGVKASADIMMTYAVIALVLSASGIFALMAYSISQHQHEIGVQSQSLDMRFQESASPPRQQGLVAAHPHGLPCGQNQSGETRSTCHTDKLSVVIGSG